MSIKFFNVVLYSLVLFIALPILSANNNNQCFSITKAPFSYTVNIYCRSNLPADSIFSFLFDTSSVRKLNTYNDSIQFFPIDSNTYEITSYFHYLAFKGYSIYRKEAFRDNDSISITLKKFSHNWTSLPKPIKADIFFKIKRDSQSSIINYVQVITVNKKLGWFESKMLQWQFEKFSKHFFATIQGLNRP
jgi:hypothetical protein